MAEKVKLSKDGSSIDFVQSESIPTSLKKFRQSPEIEGFYRFTYENDLQKEAYDILDRIIVERKAKKSAEKKLEKKLNKKEVVVAKKKKP
jgi:lipopolysaccharide biosynthesis regulator YciM